MFLTNKISKKETFISLFLAFSIGINIAYFCFISMSSIRWPYFRFIYSILSTIIFSLPDGLLWIIGIFIPDIYEYRIYLFFYWISTFLLISTIFKYQKRYLIYIYILLFWLSTVYWGFGQYTYS